MSACRAATVTADSYLVCFSLTRKSFDNLLGPIEDVWRFEALRKVPILFSLSDDQLFELAKCMKYQTLQANQLVFRKGDPGERQQRFCVMQKPMQQLLGCLTWLVA